MSENENSENLENENSENKNIEPEKQEENQKDNQDEKQEEKQNGRPVETALTFQWDEDKNISTEMENCYMEYAMSVIVSRALPDIRDGMKPVP